MGVVLQDVVGVGRMVFFLFLECWQEVVVGVLTAETDDQRELSLVSNSAVQDVGTAVSGHGPVREDSCGRLLVSGLSVLPLY